MVKIAELLDMHAPLKYIKCIHRPLNKWFNDNIMALKANRRKNELIWGKTRIAINFNIIIYYDSCMAVWWYGCMAIWLYGCMAVWLFGCMAVWL